MNSQQSINGVKGYINRNISSIAWTTFALTTLLSVYYWMQNGSQITSVYRLFPLLGLLAFSTMWGHYFMWTLREYSGADAKSYSAYSDFTHWLVLACILLHPALIIIKLYADGHGLPPASYAYYVGKPMVGFVFLGVLSLAAFLLYEFKRFIQPKKTWWKIVVSLNHLAMLAIVVHALNIGNDVRTTNLKILWPTYGAALLFMYLYLGVKRKLI